MGAYGEMAMGAGLGIGSQMLGNAMQIGQNEKLLRQQIEAQKEMGQFNNKMAYEMWLKTNYDAQRKQMEKAGLNVGLMYGGGGAGGGTAQSNSGNVSGQQASSESGLKEGAGMGLIMGMNQAQIENIKADTEKKIAEKKEVEQRTPTYAKGMEKTDAEINKIATEMGVNVETVRKIMQEIKESESRVVVQGAQVDNIKADTDNKEANTKALLAKYPEEIRNLQADTYKKYQEVKQRWKDLNIQERKNLIEQFKAEMTAKYPNVQQVIGGQMNKAVETFNDVKEYLMGLIGLDDFKDIGKNKVDKK